VSRHWSFLLSLPCTTIRGSDTSSGGTLRVHEVDLRTDGLLWLINRVVFHPRGYALGYEEGNHQFLLIGDGSETFSFGGESGETVYLERIRELMP
jgi:hypothetical protein